MPAQKNLAMEYLGTVEGCSCPCLSLGAKRFRIGHDDRTRKRLTSVQQGLEYYGILFDVSMSRRPVHRHYLGVTWAELSIELIGDGLACDAIPRDEKEMHQVRIAYQHGARRNRDGKLSFKLGWQVVPTSAEGIGTTGEYGSTISTDFTVLWETTASLERTYCLFTGGGTKAPAWKFQRRLNQAVLEANREVSLVIQVPPERAEPVVVSAKLQGRFMRVREFDGRFSTDDKLAQFRGLTAVWRSPWAARNDEQRLQHEPSMKFTLD